MHCPYCKNEDTKVLDSRVADDGGSIRRRRTCSECDRRFTTVEKMQLTVLKRSGATEPFTRGQAEFDANEVGLAILAPLRALDEVAYLRFASVYRAFESADDFENEIAMLRLERATHDQPAATG